MTIARSIEDNPEYLAAGAGTAEQPLPVDSDEEEEDPAPATPQQPVAFDAGKAYSPTPPSSGI